ncbi:MAG: hypothetical protein NVSMB66_6270 [Candidatus Doudnabacteria bacterium]
MASSNLAENITALKQMSRSLQTWTAGGATFTVTDQHVKANSLIIFFPQATQAGWWRVSSITDGTSFTITSTSAEVGNPTFYYVII